jgi:hypothetical protein
MSKREQVLAQSDTNDASKTKAYQKLQQDLQDKILLELGWNTLNKTRKIQSLYVQRITQYDCIEEAAKYGNLPNMRWLYKYNPDLPYEHTVFEAACGRKSTTEAIPILQYLMLHNCYYYINTLYHNITIPIKTLRWLYNNRGTKKWKIHDDDNNPITDMAIKDPEFDLVKYIKETGYRPTKSTFVYAINDDNIRDLRYLHGSRCPYNYRIFSYAIGHGNLEVIKFLYGMRYYWDEEILMEAITYDNLDVIVYIHNTIRPWTKDVMEWVCEHSSFLVIEWFHRNIYAINHDWYIPAIQNDNYDMVRFLHKNNIELTEEVFSNAVASTGERILDYLYENSCPVSEHPLYDAVQSSNYESTEWLLKKGYKADSDVLMEAFDQEDRDIMELISYSIFPPVPLIKKHL